MATMAMVSLIAGSRAAGGFLSGGSIEDFGAGGGHKCLGLAAIASCRLGRQQLLRLNLRRCCFHSPVATSAVVNSYYSNSFPPEVTSTSSSSTTFSSSSRDSDSLAAANPHEEHLEHYSPLVKMCGITTPEDASLAAQAGAWYVGMIMWPHSKRSVKSMSLAREICAAAREFGAEPVGVFVSESASEIERACDAAGLSFAQLHGDGARASVLELSRSLKTIYVMQSDAQGCLQTTISPELEKVIDWVLVDGLEGGSGSTFAWHNFKVPSLCTSKGWLLAGGLNPENVTKAISILRPNAVDVASGIAGSDGIRKDPSRIFAFMEAVRASSLSPCLSVQGVRNRF
ncbi:unnamed protein product [Calypogeia fissa]